MDDWKKDELILRVDWVRMTHDSRLTTHLHPLLGLL